MSNFNAVSVLIEFSYLFDEVLFSFIVCILTVKL